MKKIIPLPAHCSTLNQRMSVLRGNLRVSKNNLEKGIPIANHAVSIKNFSNQRNSATSMRRRAEIFGAIDEGFFEIMRFSSEQMIYNNS